MKVECMKNAHSVFKLPQFTNLIVLGCVAWGGHYVEQPVGNNIANDKLNEDYGQSMPKESIFLNSSISQVVTQKVYLYICAEDEEYYALNQAYNKVYNSNGELKVETLTKTQINQETYNRVNHLDLQKAVDDILSSKGS